ALLERFHTRVGVRQRHLAYPMERYAAFENFGETNRAWMEAAQELGETALDRALDRAGLERDALHALFVVSITGIASPSLDARLINRMGLRTDIKRTPIFGLGCVGGAAGLTRAADHVLAYPSQCAAVLSVELCSLTIQRNDHSVVNLISTGLFGDGAAAAIVAGADTAVDGPRIIDTRSVFYPGTEEIMGWDISENGFQVVLSPKLPDLIICRLRADVDAFLAAHELQRRDIGSWVIHPGGPKVLRAVEQALELRERDLEVSWECLARCGNLSSGSVLMVLEETLHERRPAAGTPGVIMAMGPGFCSEMLLVRW
ncbi:MAG: type III polyketide synthase, partial [Candidatus Binataceae bacterium]